ncbi:hypothetical protein Tco_0939151 [Tanacetum coccineum]|uniref:Reverse transcriptase domain-containing protein n=1 Tax=Tanacetum coccineum TaxID=301880 RepID=A0ABQ5DLZ2_9ASTR
MDDEPIWAADHVVAQTPGSAITILETGNEFVIKGNHLTLVKGNQFDGRTKTDPHKHIHEFLGICNMFKYRDTDNEAIRLMMFPLSLTREAKTWLDEFNEGSIETWDELQTAFISRLFPLALFDRLLGEICNIIKNFYHGLSEITQEALNAAAGGIFLYKTPNQAYQLLDDKVLLKLDWAKNQKSKSSFKKIVAFADEDIPGICPSFCKHKIQLLDDKKPVVQKQRRLNLNMQEVVKKEIVKLLDTCIIYPIADSPWVSPIHCVPKKGGIIVVINENDELVPTRTITGWRNLSKYSWTIFPSLETLWEKCHFMVKEEIVLGHKLSGTGLEVDKAKINVISKLPPHTNIKEFDTEIKDRKGTENVTADHLSRIENDESSADSEVDDNFPRETLMEINTKEEPWLTDFANYLVADIIPKGMTFSNAKATDQTECHKCGRKGYFTRDYWSKTSVPLYQSPFQPKLLHSSELKPELRRTKDFEAKYNKVKAKLALLSSSASAPSSSLGKNKGLIAETYDWDEQEVSADDNEVTKVKALMALTDEERVSVGKESVNNGEWLKIFIQKVHTLLEMEDNNDRKSFLDYLCIDLNYVKEQRKNLLSKHRNLVHELNTCKEQLLVLKQAKLDLFTMQHVNTEILKENQNLRNELKELTSIIEAWLNSSNKVNYCGSKDLVFVKSLVDNSEVSITGSNKPKLSKTEDSTLSIHDTGKHLIPLLEKMTGAKPVSRPKTIKSIFKLKSTFKAETLKGITINEPSSAIVRVNKSSLASKTNLAPAGKFKNVKMEDDPPLAIVIKELNELKLQISKKKSSYSKNKNAQQHHTGQGESSSRSIPSRPSVSFPSCIHSRYNDHHSNDCLYYPTYEICGSYDHDTHGHNRIISLRRGINPRNPQHVIKNCETCCSNVHATSDHNDIEWFRKRETL